MIATASLLVAIVALHYYIESAREQQIALESSRRALETMGSSAKTQQEVLDASSGTLEGMLAMSKLQGQSMKEQQALVEESVRASKKQLSIIQEQYEVERKRPDVRIFNVHRVFSGDDLSVALRNVSSKVARDITLKGFFTILRAEPFAVPVKIWDINYLRAGDVRSQWLEIDFPKGVDRNFHFELPLHPKSYASYPVVSTANSSGLFEVVVRHILAVLRSRCAGFACPACRAADTYPARPLLST